MEVKRRNILKDLIYELIQKVNILEEYVIMKRFNGVRTDHNILYFNNCCGTYNKKVLDKHGWNDLGKIRNQYF